jgi:hypothetical protein
MSLLITRLEQILRFWEDAVFLEGIGAQFEKRYNPEASPSLFDHTLPWQSLRSDLLKLDPTAIHEKYSAAPWTHEVLGGIVGVPHELSDWTQHSRRVFYTTHEIQTLLALTSFERITWGDIPWPFSSFVVLLEDPIKGTIKNWNANIDTILVSRYETPDDGTVIVFRFLGDNLDRKKPLTWLDRDQLEKAFKKGANRFADLRNGLLRRNEAKVATSFVSMFWQASLRNEFVMDTFSGPMGRVKGEHDREMQAMSDDDKDEYRPVLDAAFRVVMGLCLYLTTLPTKSVHRSEWVAPPPLQDSRTGKFALSNGAEICTVSSIHKLSAEEQGVAELAKRSFVEMAAHWRRGYWRRKPGEGNDPNALKVVLVRPTLVRKDRLQPGEVPAGTIMTV